MTIEKHDLVHEFPDHQHTIRHLKMNDRHFARLFEQYNELDSLIHKMEEGAEPTSDDVLNEKKAERVQLKDALFTFIKEAEAVINSNKSNTQPFAGVILAPVFYW